MESSPLKTAGAVMREGRDGVKGSGFGSAFGSGFGSDSGFSLAAARPDRHSASDRRSDAPTGARRER
jgi:hypothetical protein